MNSEYESHHDGNKAVCPYCKFSYQVEAEDYDESMREEECEECGKTFWIEQDFSVSTTTTPDCQLNGESHKWELMEFSTGSSAFFCATCNECSLVSDDGTPSYEKKREQSS